MAARCNGCGLEDNADIDANAGTEVAVIADAETGTVAETAEIAA